MLVHLFNDDKIHLAVALFNVDRSVTLAQPDRPLALSNTLEGLIVVTRDLSDFAKALTQQSEAVF
jgi:hypothetical protein